MTLLLLLACTPELPEPAPAPVSALGSEGSGATLRLSAHLDQAEIVLPDSIFPEGAEPGRVPLTNWKRSGDNWEHAVPVEVARKPGTRRMRLPPGAALVEGRTLLAEPKDWNAREGRIVLHRKEDPRQSDLAYVHAGLASRQARLSPGASELPPEAFVRHQVSLKTSLSGEVTRNGLLLPAPGSITWRVQIPEGARFETALAMAGNGLIQQGSDGALVKLSVDGDELATWPVSLRDSWDERSVDLSRYAGQEVELTLSTDPGGSTDWDTVFLGDPLIVGTPVGTVRRVIVIGIDTLRYDELTQQGYGKDVSEALTPFSQSAVVFDNAYAPAPRTRPSFRTATTGRYPVAAIDATNIGTVLRDHGFVTGGVMANVHLVPRFEFNAGYDYWQFQNSEDAAVQIDRAKDFLSANEDRDSMLFLHLMDPHNFYDAPGLYKNRYVEHDRGEMRADYNRWKVQSIESQLDDDAKLWLRERYDGEVAYMSDRLADFLAWTLGLPGDTLILIHSDHGEEFWDHGGYEHNHALYDEVVQANLWIRPPSGWAEGPHRVPDYVELMDIAPTIYDLLDIPESEWPEVDGVSLRPFLDPDQDSSELEAFLEARPLQIGHLMYDREQMGVIFDDHKLILRTFNGDAELYNLVDDPLEQHNLWPSADAALRAKMLTALGASFDSPAGPGWRIKIDRADSDFSLRFEVPVHAQVMDPEAAQKRRANVEWGDMPRYWPDDIGLVDYNEDHTTVTFTPGKAPRGTLLFQVPEGQGAVLFVGDEQIEIPPEGGRFTADGVVIRVTPGPVLLVQDRVADHVDLDTERDADAESQLQELGYLEEDED